MRFQLKDERVYMGLHLKYYTHASIVHMSLHKWSQTV